MGNSETDPATGQIRDPKSAGRIFCYGTPREEASMGFTFHGGRVHSFYGLGVSGGLPLRTGVDRATLKFLKEISSHIYITVIYI